MEEKVRNTEHRRSTHVGIFFIFFLKKRCFEHMWIGQADNIASHFSSAGANRGTRCQADRIPSYLVWRSLIPSPTFSAEGRKVALRQFSV